MPIFHQTVNVLPPMGALTGNPLCVFESGVPFDDVAMQAIARQMNHPGTVFLLPSHEADAQLRIFVNSRLRDAVCWPPGTGQCMWCSSCRRRKTRT